MWNDLSILDKSRIMLLAVLNGITSLSKIQLLYDSSLSLLDNIVNTIPNNNINTFSSGGSKDTTDDSNLMNTIRRRLYDNIYPFAYNNPIKRVASALLLNKPSDTQEYHGSEEILDDLWGTYLNIPETKRHSPRVLKKSKYTPSTSTNNNTAYYAIPYSAEELELIVNTGIYGKNHILNPELGEFTVNNGYDDLGHYISYYDIWDINPFTGVSNSGNKVTDFLGLNKIKDVSMGIGKPVEIYDRIYLDDYYNIPEDKRGTKYLPEIEVTPYYAKGGKIHIKPENRGKFTALKERTGHSATWFKQHGTPALKKMAVFELNARKWKHDDGGNLLEINRDNPFTVGATIDALYASSPKEEFLGEPDHHYDFTQSGEWADAHGYYLDARGHRDDRVKKPAHPSHPSRGTWNGNTFILSDLGMQNPNYTLFGLNDGGQDPQAIITYKGGIVLPEITVTPKENYVFNPYDNIILHQKALGGNLFGDGGIASYSNYLDAKDAPSSMLERINLATRIGLRKLQDKGLNPFGSGISNCTLTATQWIDPNNPVMHSANIINDPAKYGYIPITSNDAIAGDLIISATPKRDSFHSMYIEGFDNNDQPIVRYSRGSGNPEDIVRGITLDEYNTRDKGKHSETLYYRYAQNGYPLSELLVTPNGKSTGGPLYPFSFSKIPYIKTPIVRY